MLSIGEEAFQRMTVEAKDRGVTLQTLIRAVVIPEWTRYKNSQGTSAVPELVSETQANSTSAPQLNTTALPQTLTVNLPRRRAVDLYRSAYFRSLRR